MVDAQQLLITWLCRSCSRMGYFRDEFIQFFVRRASRRSPLINRGTLLTRNACRRGPCLRGVDHICAGDRGRPAHCLPAFAAPPPPPPRKSSRSLGDFTLTHIPTGYYSRHAALRQLLEQFITAARAAGKQPQVGAAWAVTPHHTPVFVILAMTEGRGCGRCGWT